MIAIIGYDKVSAGKINDILNEIGIESIVTVQEFDILNADSIILPNSELPRKSIKKCHLLNLFSVLRLLKKPFLGIGFGMYLMTDEICYSQNRGLGLFDIKSEFFIKQEVHSEVKINRIDAKCLCSDKFRGKVFRLDATCLLKKNKYTLASFEIDDVEYSAIIGDGRYYGIQFQPDIKASEFLLRFAAIK